MRPAVLSYLLLLVILVVLIELFSFSTSFLLDDLYDGRAAVLERLNRADLAAFAADHSDPLLGWDHRGPKVAKATTCLDTIVTYSYDEAGARPYAGYRPEEVEVVVVGDSYSFGAEADDEEAYPAKLAGNLHTSVANHGVGGYGPVASFLILKEKLGLYPKAKIAILGIMYENIYRMKNSYWPVLYDTFDYGLKPYISGDSIQGSPGQEVFLDLDRFRHAANDAFDKDFWARPHFGFPWSLSFYRALTSNYYYFRKFQKIFRDLGYPEYFLAYKSERFTEELVSLLNQFSRFSGEKAIVPVVLFIPRNEYDTASVSSFLERHGDRLDERLHVVDVGEADLDWGKFNLRVEDSNDICHPSAYGYREIAAYLSEVLRARSLWPAEAP